MEPAARAMQEQLADTIIHPPCLPVVCNVTAQPVSDPETIRTRLVEQVTAMVRWRESIEYMVGENVGQFVECGFGKVLAGLARRIHRPAEVTNLATPDDAAALATALDGAASV